MTAGYFLSRPLVSDQSRHGVPQTSPIFEPGKRTSASANDYSGRRAFLAVREFHQISATGRWGIGEKAAQEALRRAPLRIFFAWKTLESLQNGSNILKRCALSFINNNQGIHWELRRGSLGYLPNRALRSPGFGSRTYNRGYALEEISKKGVDRRASERDVRGRLRGRHCFSSATVPARWRATPGPLVFRGTVSN